MPDILLVAVEYGGYVSIVKLLIFMAIFFLWLPLVGWVYADANAVEAKATTWTAVLLAGGAIGALACMFVPIFAIGSLVYILTVAAPALAYVRHRNAHVMDFDRVLTLDHLKSLFASKEKKLEDLKNFIFTTANKNQVPVPEPRTPDFFGYKMAYELFTDAIYRRAATITFVPMPQEYKVTYFIDGAGIDQPSTPKEQSQYLFRFLKQLADLDIKEKRKPQKGTFRTTSGKNVTEWELSTAGSTAGEQIKIRQITKEGILKLADLGFNPDQLEHLNAFRQLKQGLFIVTGPPKHGVTTTLYALLKNHDAFMNSVITLEKKPAGQALNITQNTYSVAESQSATYGQALKQLVRMGPDIVGVGDCDDPETARIACESAEDAKLVYVAFEADSVNQALAKWLKLVGDRKIIADTLLGIGCQRLLRKLCPECRQAYTPNKELFTKFNINAQKTKVLYRAGKVVYDKHGKASTCEHCQGTGFVGRTAVFETIVLNDDLRKVVRETKSLPEIASQFRKAKMLYLQEQALRKVITGITSVNEMIRVLSPKEPKAKPAQ